MKPLIISLCDRSGIMVQPWRKAGFPCLIVDLVHQTEARYFDGQYIQCMQADVNALSWSDIDKVYGCRGDPIGAVFAFPPCTHLAISGARWFQGKGLHKLADAIRTVGSCAKLANEAGAPYFIENPIGTLATYWREPDYKFDPCDYAGYLDKEEQASEAFTKKTCLWTGGGFQIPKPKRVSPIFGSKILRLRKTELADDRLLTPKGFAKAVFEANVERVGNR